MKKNKWDTWDHVRGGRLPALPESFQPAVPVTRFFNIANSESEPEIQGIFVDSVVGSAGGGAPLAARESKDVPRSDKNCAGSNVGLPSVPSLVISNAGDDEARAKTIKPINNNWNNAWPDDGPRFQMDSQIGVFVRDWVKLTPDNVVATFSRQANDMHHKSDIDTFTGQLLSPILYPDSIVDVSRIDPALDWRRQNWTSNLLIRRPANISGLSSLTGPLRPLGQPAESKSQKQGTGQRGRILTRAGYGPRIPCHLRPAQPKDMEEVTDIYNWEVMGGIQALDTSALPVTALQDILELTQKLGMPFIVAVSGPARKVQLGSNINPYAHYPKYNADVQNQTDTEAEEKVLGFGYFSIWQPGLAGAGNGSSRATARVNLFVDSEHRRNNIGSSILHALLRTVSHQFPAGAEYEFVNPARSPVYSRPLEHERKYYQIYINYVVKHEFDGGDTGDDDNLKWVRTLLEDRFGFVEKARLECTHVTAKRPSHPPFWLDTVIFEHSCHPDPRDSRIMPKK
ncbi:hypothetical protein QBC46DRAFT_309306 [Diplogelasinospora grovesii]|uniref:N-acetyltransferase domain-containing protein n=1 Tax=Diplogelasinospora grovesii TaxID=303347 RepID=A0AAN6NES4_9PEZI|nr:hypothetical protein QBC46DRAFT_309306 [Diplogelasinospora grovesii]